MSQVNSALSGVNRTLSTGGGGNINGIMKELGIESMGNSFKSVGEKMKKSSGLLETSFRSVMQTLRFQKGAILGRAAGGAIAEGAEEGGGIAAGVAGGLAAAGVVSVLFVIATVLVNVIAKLLAGIMSGFDMMMKSVEVLGRVLGLMVMPFANLFIPLFLLLARFLIPVARVLNALLRPILTSMMRSVKPGMGAGAAMLAMGTAAFMGMNQVIIAILGGVLEILVNIFMTMFITPIQALIIMLGGVFGALLNLIPGGGSDLADQVYHLAANLVGGLEYVKLTTTGVLSTFVDSLNKAGAMGIDFDNQVLQLGLTMQTTSKMLVDGAKTFDKDFAGYVQNALDIAVYDAGVKTTQIADIFDAMLSRMKANIDSMLTNMQQNGPPTSPDRVAYLANRAMAQANAVLAALGSHGPGGGNTLQWGTGPLPYTGVPNDFISRPGAGISPFSPDDTIIGMKDPSKLGKGANITININGAGMDTTQLVRMISKELQSQLGARTVYGRGT